MAKGRIISRSISTSRKVSVVSDQAALLLSWMIPHTDDFGRLEGGADDILFAVVPRRKWDEKQVDRFIKELFLVSLIRTYHDNEKRYIEISDFEKHQTFRSDRSRVAKCPLPKSYDKDWYTNDNQREKPAREVKLSQVKLSQAKKNTETHSKAKPLTSKKEQTTNPDVKPLIDFFYKAAKAIQGVQTQINGGKVGKLLKKRLEAGIDRVRIEKMIVWYLTQKTKYQDERKEWQSKFKHSPDFGVMLSDAFFNQLLSDEVNALTYMRDNIHNLEKIYANIGYPTKELSLGITELLAQLSKKMAVKPVPQYD